MFVLPQFWSYFWLKESSSRQEQELIKLSEVLSQQIAQQMQEPLIQSDIISIQAIVQHVANHSMIHSISLSDTDQNLLAQAGKVERTRVENLPQIYEVNLPIMVNQTIAGYLELKLNHPSSALSIPHWLLGNSILFVLFLCAIIILARHYLQTEASQNSSFLGKGNLKIASVGMGNNSEGENLNETQSDTIQLLIFSPQLQVIEQQLTKTHYQQVINALQHRLEQLKSLYNASYFNLIGNSLVIYFSQKDNNAGFNALCSAKLILHFTEYCVDELVPGSQLDVVCFIGKGMTIQQDSFRLQLLNQLSHGTIAMEAELMKNLDAEDKVEVHWSGKVCYITDFIASFAKLLYRQHRQLLSTD